METKHTPGPWKVGEKFYGVTNQTWICFTDDVFDYKLATVYNGTKITNDQVEANAKLIAAAPDLLEACIMAFDNMQNGESKTKYRLVTCLNALEEAIKKATK